MNTWQNLSLIAALLVAHVLAPVVGEGEPRVATTQPAAISASPAPDPIQQGLAGLSPLACGPDGVQPSGAIYRICMPAFWNGDLLVYAHGYVSPTRPVAIPEDQLGLPGGPSLPDVANLMGFAFAVTSYRMNGLAVLPAIADLTELVEIFTQQKGAPARVILVGVSEGGLITALALERHADVFDGGLALCGPYGSMRGQIDYFGDARVLFDYFFPALLPPSPVAIPPDLLANWEGVYTTTIRPVLVDPIQAGNVEQLLATAKAPFDAANPTTKEATIQGLLWYNVFATNDGIQKLGGQPYDNRQRLYTGSHDDANLNQSVARFDGDAQAQAELSAHYETTGLLAAPLVTMHTTGDPIVPFWHLARYRAKTIQSDSIAWHEAITVSRYGHCNFTSAEVLGAFNRLRALIDNPPPYQPVQRLYLPAVLSPS